ncbi:hypothetical protein LH417_13765 [Laribacter hongkongensis]|uniref:hypothetical protein n=1 Tax=Laribacter hongkongensis TaxID=168471 RepID=UPI001EFEEA84|nr:hypothetical protein [Laribacter hongkongensis]MCG9023978.1 hypothetical protein [Laribacter hongkongensis]
MSRRKPSARFSRNRKRRHFAGANARRDKRRRSQVQPQRPTRRRSFFSLLLGYLFEAGFRQERK